MPDIDATPLEKSFVIAGGQRAGVSTEQLSQPGLGPVGVDTLEADPLPSVRGPRHHLDRRLRHLEGLGQQAADGGVLTPPV